MQGVMLQLKVQGEAHPEFRNTFAGELVAEVGDL